METVQQTTGKVSKEAADVLGLMGTQRNKGGEKQPAQTTTTTTKSEEGKAEGDKNQPAAQQTKVDPIVIGGKAKAKEKEVVATGQATEQQLAVQKAEQEREDWFNSQVSERFKGDFKTVSEKLSKIEQYEEQLKADPYKNPFTKQLDELLAKNIPVETAIKYLTTDVAKLSPRELIAFKMQQDMPELTIEQINRKIDRQYKLGTYAPTKEVDGKEVPQEQDGLDDLLIDSQPIKKDFETLKNKQLEGKSRINVQAEQAEVQRIGSWQPAVEKVLDSFDKIEVDAPNGRKLQFMVEMEPAEKQLYTKALAMWAKSNPGLAANEEGMATAKQELHNAYLIKNFAKMTIAFADQARSWNEEQWIQEINNPFLANTAGKTDFGKTKTGSGDRIYDVISGVENGRAQKKR